MANQKNSTKKTTTKRSTKPATKKSTKTTTKAKEQEKSFLQDTTENIEQGAKVVGDKAGEIASEIADKAGDVGKTVVDKIKEGVSEAYDFGTKAFEGISEAAQAYAEKYKHKVEIRELKVKQEDTYAKLGSVIFDKHKVESVPADQIFKDKDTKDLIGEIEKITKEIVKLGKKLDKL